MDEKTGNQSGAPPAGAMVQIDTDLIDEGKFRKRLDRAVLQAHRALREHVQDCQDRKARAVVLAKITLQYDVDADEHVSIDHAVKVQAPVRTCRTYVKEKAGLLLCQPGGSSADAPEQQKFFYPNGMPINTETGEKETT